MAEPTPDVRKHYTRQVILILEVRMVVVILLSFYLVSSLGANLVRPLLALTHNYRMAMALYALLFFTALGLIGMVAAMARSLLNRRYGLARGSLLASFGIAARQLAVQTLGWTTLASIIYLSIFQFPERWWILAAVIMALAWLGIFALYPLLMMSFVGKITPLEDTHLRERLIALAHRAGLQSAEVSQWNIGSHTAVANAMVSGLGRHRRIVVTDTTLEVCTHEEIEAVVAHELGHRAHRDLEKRIALIAASQFLTFWIIQAIAAGIPHFIYVQDFRNLPALYIGYLGTFALLLQLILRLYRRQEHAADLYAWELMGTSTTFISGLKKLEARNLLQVQKKNAHRFGHPTTEAREAEAQKFEAAKRGLKPAVVFGSIS